MCVCLVNIKKYCSFIENYRTEPEIGKKYFVSITFNYPSNNFFCHVIKFWIHTCKTICQHFNIIRRKVFAERKCKHCSTRKNDENGSRQLYQIKLDYYCKLLAKVNIISVSIKY